MPHTPRDPARCEHVGREPHEHCGDIFCAPCKARFPRDYAYYKRIELSEHFGTYDSEEPPTREPSPPGIHHAPGETLMAAPSTECRELQAFKLLVYALMDAEQTHRSPAADRLSEAAALTHSTLNTEDSIAANVWCAEHGWPPF